jgi:anti-sigma factor RsiW
MRHQYWNKQLSAYLDNELSLKAKEKMETHLETCVDCRQRLNLHRQLQREWKSIPELVPNPYLWTRIAAQLDQTPRRVSLWEQDWVTRILPTPILSLVVMVLMVLMVIVAQPYFSRVEINEVTANTLTEDEEISKVIQTAEIQTFALDDTGETKL